MKQTFDVKGMTCAACQAHVEKAAGKLDGVKSAQVSLMLGRMEVEYDENAIDAAKICDAVTREGYPASVHGQTQQVAAQPQAEKASNAPLMRLIATAALSILLFYIAMGPMLGLPQIPIFAGDENVMVLALAEAALSLGMRDGSVFFKIVFPRALRSVVPALISELVIVLKDTTFAYVVNYADLMQNAKVLISNYDALLSVYLVVAVIYILINYAVNKLAEAAARRTAPAGKEPLHGTDTRN